MFKYIRENSGIIVKFMMTHLVMSILGIMVGLSVLSIEGETEGISAIAIIGSVFTVGFMCFMHYDDMYFYAVKEGIRIRSEGGKFDNFKGLKLTLIGYAPVILSGLAAIIVELLSSDVENTSATALFIYYILQGSFLSLYKIRITIGVIGYVVITLLPAVVSSVLGYYVGSKDKTIRGMLGMNVKPPFDGPLERKPKDNK